MAPGEQVQQSHGSLFKSPFMAFNNAAQNDPMRDQLWNRHLDQPDLSILEPLYAVAKAEKGPGVEAGVGELARDAIGMLCAMAHANPAYVDRDHRPMAVRSRWIGLDCYRQLENILSPYRNASMGRLDPPTAGGLSLKQEVWGITQTDLAAVVMDVLMQEPSFLRFVDGNLRLDYGPGTQNEFYGFDATEMSTEELLKIGRYGRNVFLVNLSVSLRLVETLMGVAQGSDTSSETREVSLPGQPPPFPEFQPGSPPPDPAEFMRMLQQNMQQFQSPGQEEYPAQESDWSHLTAKAKKVLQRLSMGVDGGEHTFGNLAWDRRLFRQAILESAQGREKLVSSLFCHTGWGEPGEFVDYALNQIDQMIALITTYRRHPIPPEHVRRIEDQMSALVTMRQSAMVGRGNSPLVEAIDEKIAEIREWASSENPDDDISYTRFVRFHTAAVASCP